MAANEKYLADGSDYEMSLKKMGLNIADILGYVSHEFGEDTPVFKITDIVLADGTTIGVEGEHDIPYLPCDDQIPCLTEEFLNENVD